MIVAIECAEVLGSVAVCTPSGDLHEALLDGSGSQAGQLLPALQGLLAATNGSIDGIREVLVGEGPGSFTGVRVAAAAGLGLSRAIGVPLRRASSLAGALLASGVADSPGGQPAASPAGAPPSVRLLPDGRYAVLFDARGDRLYVGAFEWQGRELTVTEPPRFAHLSDIIVAERSLFATSTLLGAGADRHRVALTEAGFVVAPAGTGAARASGLLTLRQWAPHQTSAWREGDEPCYLRASSAEREARPS